MTRAMAADVSARTLKNLCLDPRAKNVGSYWATYGGGMGGGTTNVALTQVAADWSRSGLAARVTSTAAGNTGIKAELSLGVRGSVVPHHDGTLTVTFRGRASRARASGYIRFRGESGAAERTVALPSQLGTAANEFTVTITGLTMGSSYGVTYLESGTTETFAQDEWIEASDVMIVAGTTPEPYGDGTTPGWKWVGTPDASVSVGYPYSLESIAGQPTTWYDYRRPFGVGVPPPADGTLLTSWMDLARSSLHLASSGAASPVWTPDGIMFDGVDDRLFANAVPVLPDGSTTYLVARQDAVVAGSFVKYGNDQSGYGIGAGTGNMDSVSDGSNLVALMEQLTWVGSSPVVNLGAGFNVISLSETTGTARLHLNGVVTKTVAFTGRKPPIGLTSFGGYTANQNMERFAQATLACVVTFAKEHDLSTRNRVEKWLGTTYGVQIT